MIYLSELFNQILNINFKGYFCLSGIFPNTEDEQRKNIGSQKSVHQLTVERDQALADLNSVERSFSDLFRRYENMKTVLEGFKKVSYHL